MKHIKYLLLRWLLDDICVKSYCKNCALRDSYSDCACYEDLLFVQARRVWGVGGKQ